MGRAATTADRGSEPWDAVGCRGMPPPALLLAPGPRPRGDAAAAACGRDVSLQLLAASAAARGRQSIPVNLANALFIG